MSPYSFPGTKWRGGPTIRQIKAGKFIWTHLKSRPPLDAIIRLVAVEFGVPKSELSSICRKRNLADARKVYSVLAKQYLYSFKDIGRAINKDHSTIIAAVRVAEWHCETEPAFKKKLEDIKTKLKNLPF